MWHILHISDLNRVEYSAHIILHKILQKEWTSERTNGQRARVAQQHQTASNFDTDDVDDDMSFIYIWVKLITHSLSHSIRRKSNNNDNNERKKIAHDKERRKRMGATERERERAQTKHYTVQCVFFYDICWTME